MIRYLLRSVLQGSLWNILFSGVRNHCFENWILHYNGDYLFCFLRKKLIRYRIKRNLVKYAKFNKAVFLSLVQWLWDQKSVHGALGRCLCWFGLIFPTGFTNHCFWNLTLVTVKTVTYRCQKKTWHSPNN